MSPVKANDERGNTMIKIPFVECKLEIKSDLGPKTFGFASK
jgi:hypothetical protein